MTLEAMHFTEQQPHNEIELDPVVERRREIQRQLSWVALIMSEAGQLYNELIAETLANNQERRERGVDIDTNQNYVGAPRIDEMDVIAVQAFLKSAGVEAPEEPQLRMKPEAA